MPRRRDDQLLRAIGVRVKEVRTSRGWTQQRLAEAVGMEPITISRLETGDRGLSISNLALVAEKLGVDLGVLVDEKRPPPEAPGTGPSDEELARLCRALPVHRRELVAHLLRELGE